MIIFLLFFSLLFSCQHLTNDPFENHATLNYHRLEFDSFSNDQLKKEIGIANFNISKDFNNQYFTINGIYKGTMYLQSKSCNIDTVMRFNRLEKFYLSNLISGKNKCQIKFILETDKIGKRQHGIIETGIVKINNIGDCATIITKNNEFECQGSIQKRAGSISRHDYFRVESISYSGSYMIVGCSNLLEGKYKNNGFNVYYKKLYDKPKLTIKDSCDFEIIIIPNKLPNSFYARFSVNIFDSKVIKHPPVNWTIKRNRLRIRGDQFTIATCINKKCKTKKKMKIKYRKNKIYWLKSITRNGRKSIIAIENNKIKWQE